MNRAVQIGRSFPWLQSHRFAFSAIAAVACRLMAACLTFVLGIVLARVLGFTVYGEYAFVLAIVQLIAIVSKFGLDNASLRFASEYRAANRYSTLRTFLRDTTKTNLMVSFGIALIVAFATWLLRAQLSVGLLACSLWGAILLAVLPVTQVREATLVALGKVTQGILGPVIVPAAFIILLLSFHQFATFSCTSSIAMFLHVIAALGALFVASVFLSQTKKKYSDDGQQPAESRNEWRWMAFSMMLVNVLIYIQGQSGTIFSGAFLGTEQAGLYSVAARISGASLLGLSSINMIAAPHMSALHSSGDKKGLQKLAKLCAWGSLACSIPIVLLTAYYGKTLLQNFGEEFVEAYSALLVLLVGLIINASTGSVAHLLYMTGHHATCLRIYGVIAAMTVVLHICLIPYYGIWGAAVTTTVVQVAWNLALVYYVRKIIGVWSILGFSASIPS